MRNLGINYTSQPGIEPGRLFPLFREIGFTHTFIGMPTEASVLEQYVGEATKAGLTVESIHAPFDHINDIWMEGDAGEAMTMRLIDTVKACARDHIPIAVLHLSSGDHPPCVNDLGHARFDRVVDAAVGCGVTVAFENQRKLANIAFVFELYDQVENVGFCWDVGHEMCFADGRQYMPLFGKKLCYTHIHDNFCVHNADLHLLPFDGKIDFSRCMNQICESGFGGTLTLEVFPGNSGLYAGCDPETFYRRAYRAALRLRDMLDG